MGKDRSLPPLLSLASGVWVCSLEAHRLPSLPHRPSGQSPAPCGPLTGKPLPRESGYLPPPSATGGDGTWQDSGIRSRLPTLGPRCHTRRGLPGGAIVWAHPPPHLFLCWPLRVTGRGEGMTSSHPGSGSPLRGRAPDRGLQGGGEEPARPGLPDAGATLLRPLLGPAQPPGLLGASPVPTPPATQAPIHTFSLTHTHTTHRRETYNQDTNPPLVSKDLRSPQQAGGGPGGGSFWRMGHARSTWCSGGSGAGTSACTSLPLGPGLSEGGIRGSLPFGPPEVS